jgi:hypothetical protein
MTSLLVVGAIVGAYLVFFNKPSAARARAATAPQGSAASAADPNAAATEYAARLKAEALGRIMAFEDLQKHADQMRQVVEALDPNGTPSVQTPTQ